MNLTVTSEDIKQRLAKINAKTLLEKVISEDNPSQQYHYSKEEVSSAIDFLMEKLTLNPEDLTILEPLSQLLFIDNQLEASYDHASRILEVDNENVKAYLIRAKCFMAWNNFQDNLEEINQAIELSNETKETVDKITDHYRDPLNDNTILEVEPNEQLRELLQFRDRILQRMHTSMTGMYS